MKCPKCGSRIANNSLFCKYCGYKIPQKPKYIRSRAMKVAMRVLIVGLSVFAIGAYLAIIYHEVGLVLVGAGGVLLVGGCIAYLCAEFIKHKKEAEDECYTHVTSLPIEPIVLDSRVGFIFPDLENIEPYFKNAIAHGSTEGWVDIMFNQSLLTQIIDCPEEKNGEKHNIGIFFFPYLYEDKHLYMRFEDNDYMDYFSNNPVYSDEGVDAYFGTDIHKALQVASYILASVYYIPTYSKLKVNGHNINSNRRGDGI